MKGKKGVENSNYFVDNLKRLRHFYMMNQNEFGLACGFVDPKRVSEIEIGRFYPRPDELEKVSQFCGYSVLQLCECVITLQITWEHPFDLEPKEQEIE